MSCAFLAIVNRAAGAGRCATNAPDALRELERHGVTLDVSFTERPGHAAELAESVGYVRLPREIYSTARDTFNNRPRPRTGTHFVHPEGKWYQASLTELYVHDNLVE